MRREVGRAELRPSFRYDLGAGHHLLVGDHEVVEGVAAVRVVGMDVGDLLCGRPSLRRRDRAGHAVGRLDVGDAERELRVRHRLVPQEVGAAVNEDGEQTELLGDRSERGGITAGYDAGEHVDLLGELHAAKLFHVGVGAGVLVRRDGLDLTFAENTALRVDLLGGQHVALERGLSEHCRGPGKEGHVAQPEWAGGNISLRRPVDLRHGRSNRRHRCCRGPYRNT